MPRSYKMQRKSTVLIMVLIFMIVIGFGITALLQAMISYSNMKIVNVERLKAFYLAEGYSQIAIWQLSNGDTSNFDTKVDDMMISVTKTEDPPGSGIYRIEVSTTWQGL